MGEVLEAQEMIEELKCLQQDYGTSRIYQKLLRKVSSELKQLQKKKEADKKKVTSNIPHLRGVLDTVTKSEGVREVICSLKNYGIVVDVISDAGRTWKKVVAKNAQASHLIWAGQGQYGTKDITKAMEKYLAAAHQFCDFAPPKVVCVFCKGVTNEMAEYLEGCGVVVEGERVTVSEDTLRRLEALENSDYETESEIDEEEYTYNDSTHSSRDTQYLTTQEQMRDAIFLDVTSLVVYISDVCNGGANFKFKDATMSEQAEQELANPVMPLLKKYIVTRRIVTCQTALDNFRTFVEALGGEKEKKRAAELTKMITVVPDTVSSKFQQLKTGGKIKTRAKTIFGTADQLQCEILTSNEAFVRAAAAQGINTAAILHPSRALSELTRTMECNST